MTIVGMVPPVYYKGDLLVDGGYMNNIPVDVMRSMGVDTVMTLPAVHAQFILLAVLAYSA
jgi:predicted acylesterase/phospholipase RssA